MSLIKTRIRYRRARVTVEIEKFGYCQACGQAGRTEFHHYKYAYKTSDVRKFPELAKLNTIELCYQCHRIADSLRKLEVDSKRTQAVIDILEKKKGGNHVTIQPGRCRGLPVDAA